MASKIRRFFAIFLHPNSFTLAKLAVVSVAFLAVATTTIWITSAAEFGSSSRHQYHLFLSIKHYASASLAHLPTVICLLAIIYADRVLKKSGGTGPVQGRVKRIEGDDNHEHKSPCKITGNEENPANEDEQNTLFHSFGGRHQPETRPSMESSERKEPNREEGRSQSEAAPAQDGRSGTPTRDKHTRSREPRPPRYPASGHLSPNPGSETEPRSPATMPGKCQAPPRNLTDSPPCSPQFRRRRYNPRFASIDQVGPANRRQPISQPSKPAHNQQTEPDDRANPVGPCENEDKVGCDGAQEIKEEEQQASFDSVGPQHDRDYLQGIPASVEADTKGETAMQHQENPAGLQEVGTNHPSSPTVAMMSRVLNQGR